ncbi:MAG: serine O-acetyltransferase [Rubripirellula sp.]
MAGSNRLTGAISRLSHAPEWSALQAEANTIREPLLAHFIERTVLQSTTFIEGLANLISEKLFSVNADEWRLEFLHALHAEPEMGDRSFRDLLAIRRNDPATSSLLQPFLNFKGFHALVAYRFSHRLWMRNRVSLARHLQSQISERFGIDIHPAATIGEGVFLDHGTGVVIGETAVVGNDVTILHGVTLGGTGKASGDRHPKVGDGVFVGASAQLLGNIKIGDHATIGASSVVLKDVPEASTVAGIPARVIKRGETTAPRVAELMA